MEDKINRRNILKNTVAGSLALSGIGSVGTGLVLADDNYEPDIDPKSWSDSDDTVIGNSTTTRGAYLKYYGSKWHKNRGEDGVWRHDFAFTVCASDRYNDEEAHTSLMRQGMFIETPTKNVVVDKPTQSGYIGTYPNGGDSTEFNYAVGELFEAAFSELVPGTSFAIASESVANKLTKPSDQNTDDGMEIQEKLDSSSWWESHKGVSDAAMHARVFIEQKNNLDSPSHEIDHLSFKYVTSGNQCAAYGPGSDCEVDSDSPNIKFNIYVGPKLISRTGVSSASTEMTTDESLHPEKMSEEMKNAINLQKVKVPNNDEEDTLSTQSQDTEEVYLASFDVQRVNSDQN